MNGPETPQRLRLSTAPGSTLAAGLSAARTREPSAAQLRALETALAASLGAAAAGAGMSAAGRVATSTPAGPAVPSLSFAAAGALKLTAVFVALAAAAGGVTMFRHGRHVAASNPKVMVRSAQPIASSPLPAAPMAPDLPVEAAVAAPQVARAERPSSASHARRGPDRLALIARAQRTLATDPAAALALIEDNGRVLAQSSFAQEAEVIAVAALARLGRMDEARSRAARFVARFPDSVHVARMRRVAAIIN